MIGGSGDDTFIVRAFLVAAGTHIGVPGGREPHHRIQPRRPGHIEGGTGFNTLIIIGTEADDRS